jgi:hypothetical protein
MDSWYATQRLMGLIDNLGKFYYCPLKNNRLIDDTGGVEKYQKVQDLNWNEAEKSSGKTIKIICSVFLIIISDIYTTTHISHFKYTTRVFFNEEYGLQALLLLITINNFCNMYFYLQTS